MSKTYRSYEPEQLLLLPPSVKDWLPTGHPAQVILNTEMAPKKALMDAGYFSESNNGC